MDFIFIFRCVHNLVHNSLERCVQKRKLVIYLFIYLLKRKLVIAFNFPRTHLPATRNNPRSYISEIIYFNLTKKYF